ncbi:protein HOOK3 [Pelomyxa schiedti]|nr:protein HOOK3 [Pelomyxa schiedti]
MDNYALLINSLVAWVRTFKVPRECNTLRDLSDGVILYSVLTQIIPEHAQLNGKLRPGSARGAHLNAVLSLLDYYYEVELSMPNNVHFEEAKIQMGDTHEIMNVLQLIMGVLMVCKNRTSLLERVQQMEMHHQEQLTIFIENAMQQHSSGHGTSKEPDEPPPPNSDITDTFESTQFVGEQVNEEICETDLEAEIESLNAALAKSEAEKEMLMQENERLHYLVSTQDNDDKPVTQPEPVDIQPLDHGPCSETSVQSKERIQQMEAKVETLTSELEQKMADYHTQEEQLSLLREQMEAQGVKMAEMETQIATLDNDKKCLCSENEQLQTKCLSQEKEVRSLQQTSDRQRSQLSQLQGIVADHQLQLGRLELNNSQLTKKLAAAEGKLVKQEANYKSMIAEQDRKMKRSEAIEIPIVAPNSTSINPDGSVEALKKENMNLQVDVAKLKEELSTMKTLKEEVEELRQHKAEVLKLKEEVEDLRNKNFQAKQWIRKLKQASPLLNTTHTPSATTASASSAPTPLVTQLQQTIEDRNREIDTLRKAIIATEQELNLVVTAFYTMAAHLPLQDSSPSNLS